MSTDNEIRAASMVTQSAWAEMYRARERWFSCSIALRHAEDEYLEAAKLHNRAEDTLNDVQTKKET